MITISAFRWVPEFARGQVRDLRVRWALEEAGLPYKTRLLEQGDQDKPEYRRMQPFGQVPIFEEDGSALFESGVIVLHIGERCEALLPRDPGARARAAQWVVAAARTGTRANARAGDEPVWTAWRGEEGPWKSWWQLLLLGWR